LGGGGGNRVEGMKIFFSLIKSLLETKLPNLPSINTFCHFIFALFQDVCFFDQKVKNIDPIENPRLVGHVAIECNRMSGKCVLKLKKIKA